MKKIFDLYDTYDFQKKIDIYTVGIGPGRFSALRMACSFFNAAALPSATPVTGVGSALATSAKMHSDTGEKQIAVIGDARRNHIWISKASFENDFYPVKTDFTVCDLSNWNPKTLSDYCTVSADWERLPIVTSELHKSGYRLIMEPAYPTAEWVARLGERDFQQGTLRPAIPIYPHPSVTATPPSCATS